MGFNYEDRIYFPISRKLTQKRSRYNTSYNDWDMTQSLYLVYFARWNQSSTWGYQIAVCLVNYVEKLFGDGYFSLRKSYLFSNFP